MTRAAIGLGANLGDAAATLREAIAALARLPATELLRTSRLYRTPAWGRTEQPDFINAVALVETALPPRELLDALLVVERSFGRVRLDGERWGPRTLDLDLLLHDAQSIDTPRLSLPHPRMHLRAFVLVPLCEIAPDCRIPGRGKAAAWLPAVRMQGIEKIMPTLDADKRSETFP